jgi:sensor domain CHASE-containing protein
MKSFVAVALCLSLFSTFARARIPHSYRQLQERDDELQSPDRLLNWFMRMLKRQQKRQQDVCYQDQYYDFVNNSTFGQNFCQVLGISYPNRTIVDDFTPVV